MNLPLHQRAGSMAEIQRPRQRTLTGCYTCRERKLKCDDTRPSCRRCIALGVECQGYEIKLSWIPYQVNGQQERCIKVQPRHRHRRKTSGNNEGDAEVSLCRRPLFSETDRLNMVLETQREFVAGNQDRNVSKAIDELDRRAERIPRKLGHYDHLGPFSVFVLGSTETTDQLDGESCSSAQADAISLQEPISDSDVPALPGHTVLTHERTSPQNAENTRSAWLFPGVDCTITSGDLPRQSSTQLAPSWDLVGQYPYPSDGDQTAQQTFTELGLGCPETTMVIWNHGQPDYGSVPLHPPHGSFHHNPVYSISRTLSSSQGLLKIPPESQFLLEYYATEVVNFMCHLPNPNSPWRTIHLPWVMSTMSDFAIFGNVGKARLALFYALLSVSSNHLSSKIAPLSSEATQKSLNMTSETTGNRYSLPPNNGSANYWLARGLSFQNEAAAQIRACLQSHGFDMQEMYQALLMSLLSMVTISVTSGKLSSAHTYLQGAGKLIQRYQLARSSLPSWKSRSLTALHQIYLYLQTIHSSTHISWASCSGKNIDTESSSNSGFIKEVHGLAACGSQPSVTPQTNFDSLLDYGGDRQLLTNIYGVPYSLLKLIGRASELAKEVEEHGETVHDTTGFRLRCEKLEDDICTYQSSPSNGENLTSNFRPDDTCMQISSHLAHAMHDALIVMFFRRVRKVHRAVLQHHVKSTLGHLKDQEAIKTGAGIHAPALLWPWFMVAAEATGEDLREEARQWSGVAMRYGGRNIEAAEQVVREVWRRHDQRLSRATWVDVVREWAVSLVLT